MSARILAIESSCDESACAIVEGRRVLSSVVASQIETHAKFGGVVPELASRAHLDATQRVYAEALQRAGLQSLDSIDAIAVTEGPGLIGALLVGLQFAKGLALASGKPLYGIHHMEGHLFSAGLAHGDDGGCELLPHLALLVSGGHTELVEVRGLGEYQRIGGTRDDAVGEAYDKVGKMLGLGYPGGPVIDRLAQEGRADAIAFPRAMLHQPNFEFSFAGLKTAVAVHLDKVGQPSSLEELRDVCASFQAAVVEVLVTKTLRALAAGGLSRVHVVGGAAANSGLRSALTLAAEERGFTLRLAPLAYCGDNAAMIASAASARVGAGADRGVDLYANRPLDHEALGLRRQSAPLRS
jgi:N6-L-threonylcarbamoyladenine synthase